MPINTLSFDLNGSFAAENPVLSVWYGGMKLSSILVQSSATGYTIDIDTDNNTFNHSELRFSFVNNGSEASRQIFLNNIQINGSTLNPSDFFGSHLDVQGSTIVLDQAEFVDYETSALIPEVSDNIVIQGTAANEKLNGTTHDETINGQGGHDSLYGYGGADSIYGGDGFDTLIGGDGNDQLYGGDGNDKAYGGNGDDRLEGNDGNDRLEGNDGNDTIYGGLGNDTIVAGAGDDIAYGEDGNDLIIGSSGSRNELYGGNGLDKIYGAEGDDRLDGGADRDIIGGYDGDDTLYGGDGDDHLDGHDGNDNVYGDAGNDKVYGNTGNDNVRGGAGDDFVYGNGGVDTVYGEDGNDYVAAGDGNDFAYGGNDDDFVGGEDGNDRVEGDDGNDAVSGGFGADILLGENGNDIIYGGGLDSYDVTLLRQADPTLLFNHSTQSLYKIVTGPVTKSAAETAAALETVGGVAGQLLSIESALENTFITTELGNAGVTSSWLSASDSATAGTWVWGSGQVNGSTFFSSGAAVNNAYTNFETGQSAGTGGQDNLLLNSSGTWQDEGAATTSAYVIEWNYEDVTADNSADQIFGGLGDDLIFGGGGQDTIKGDDGNDLIFGGLGIDTISGNDGTDAIYGGEGADTINGGAGIDNIFGGAGNDRIFFDNQDIVDGGANFDTLILDSFLSGALDFSNLTSIQHIALDNYNGNAAANTLTMSYADVASISDSNTLYITADLGLDIVTISDLDAATDFVETTILNGTVYERYSNGSENIYLELGIITANQAFLIDPVSTTSLDNSVDINTGSYLAKTTGLSFETDSDVTSTQVLYEQGGGTRGLNFYIEAGELHIAAWNFAEENWGYKEVTVAIAANTRYTTSMVFDGAFPANGTIEGFLDGVSVGTATGVGNLYAHSGGIEIGGNDNTVINGASNNNALTFTGTVQKAAQYNAAYSGLQLDGFHDFLSSNWLIDPLTNTAPDAADDTITVTSGQIETVDVLLNDSDPDGHTVSVSSVGTASNGTVTLNPDGTVTYQSNLGYSGSDSFTYTISDGLATDTATVTVTVDPAAGGGIADPSEITGLVAWYDTNDATSHIDGNGDLVLDGINDKTANGLNATQGTGSSQPNVVTLGGDQWMEFDGNDLLQIADSNLINTGGPFNGKTISISFTTGADVNTRQVIYEQGGGTRGINFFIDSGDIYLNGWNRNETQWGPANVTGSLTANTAYVATMVYDGVAGTITGYLNGTFLGTVSGLDLLYAHSDDTGIGGVNGSTYFLTGTGGGNGFTGHIGEVALYNTAISGADRTALDQYMVDTWVTPPAAPVEDPPVESVPEPVNTGMTLMGNIANDTLIGQDGNDMIHGDGGLDTLIGSAGDDEISGGDDNDILWGDDQDGAGEDGNDLLNGEAGRDHLYGEGGDDTLLFGEGADYLYGGAGADTFKAYETAGQDNDMAFALDFNVSEGDKVDISHLLSGFDPLTDSISDFVNIAQGNHTTIQVDRTGSGGANGWDNVLRLQGNTTLNTDETQLIADGTLIV